MIPAVGADDDDEDEDNVSITSIPPSPYLSPLDRWPAYSIFSVCACMLGLASWITINATWTELPILTSILPEGLSLPSYVILITQIANIGPFIYTTLVLRYGERFNSEAAVIWFILLIGLLSSIAVAFYWCETTNINGRTHSLALLLLLLMLSTIDCTSSVSFVPHIAVQWPPLLLPYFIGEGLCALVPSLLALAQDIEQTSLAEASSACTSFANVAEPANNDTSPAHAKTAYRGKRFSVRVYFLIVSGLLLFSLVAFTALICWRRWTLRKYLTNSTTPHSDEYGSTSTLSATPSAANFVENDNYAHANNYSEDFFHSPVSYAGNNAAGPSSPFRRRLPGNLPPDSPYAETMPLLNESVPVRERTSRVLLPPSLLPPLEPRWEWMPFFPYGSAMALVALLAVGMLQVQAFSTAAYGPQVFLYAATASQVANPVGRLLTVFWCPTRLRTVTAVCLVMTCLSAYFIFVTVLPYVAWGKQEPLFGIAGAFLMVIAWFLFALGAAYARVVIIKQLQPHGRKALVSVGAAYQIGAAVGAVMFFVMLKLFACFVVNDKQQCGW